MNCDMCGKLSNLYKVDIEGTRMQVCEACAKFGKVIAYPQAPVKKKKDEPKSFLPEKPEIVQVIVSDYGMRIKNKRDKMGLKQEELAKQLNERESLLHNIESGHFEPNIELARKFERFLGIKLVEEVTDDKPILVKGKNQELTLGDMVKVRKR